MCYVLLCCIIANEYSNSRHIGTRAGRYKDKYTRKDDDFIIFAGSLTQPVTNSRKSFTIVCTYTCRYDTSKDRNYTCILRCCARDHLCPKAIIFFMTPYYQKVYVLFVVVLIQSWLDNCTKRSNKQKKKRPLSYFKLPNILGTLMPSLPPLTRLCVYTRNKHGVREQNDFKRSKRNNNNFNKTISFE